jgi:hypothetical protein
MRKVKEQSVAIRRLRSLSKRSNRQVRPLFGSFRRTGDDQRFAGGRHPDGSAHSQPWPAVLQEPRCRHWHSFPPCNGATPTCSCIPGSSVPDLEGMSESRSDRGHSSILITFFSQKQITTTILITYGVYSLTIRVVHPALEIPCLTSNLAVHSITCLSLRSHLLRSGVRSLLCGSAPSRALQSVCALSMPAPTLASRRLSIPETSGNLLG